MMKKFIILLGFILITSCNDIPKPIETYSDMEFIIVDIGKYHNSNTTSYVILKNHKDIIKVRLLNFDLELYNYKIGDTIK